MKKKAEQTKRTAAQASVPKKKGRADASSNAPMKSEKAVSGGDEGVKRLAPRDRPHRDRKRKGPRCSAMKANGQQCLGAPIKGSTVCHKHGGSAPQVRAKANQRLIEMVIPAMKELHKIINRDDVADADKLKAISMVLNRTGYSERQTIDIGLREPTPFDNLKNTAFQITRGTELREELEQNAHPELPTPQR